MSDCEIQADPDLLGIGVRLGFYFQFASNLVLLFTRQDEAVQSITLSNLFMIAYFIAAIQSLILNNLPPGAVIPITSFFFLDGSLATVIYFATLQTMSYWTHVVFMVRYAGICGFHLWFWFSVLGMSVNLAVSLFQSYKILISVQNMRDIWRFHSF